MGVISVVCIDIGTNDIPKVELKKRIRQLEIAIIETAIEVHPVKKDK